MLTIATWPTVDTANQYLRLYYDGLREHGIVLGPVVEFRDSFLREHVGLVDALHLHWGLEQIWRVRGETTLGRARGVAGFWRYLRLARRLNIRLLWTLHDIENHEGVDWIDRLGYRLIARHCDLCITHDAATAALFVTRFGGLGQRTCVMKHGNYDGVFPSPEPRAQTLSRLGIDPSSRVLLCQGIVREYKGFDTAIEAVSLLSGGYHLIIAGRALDVGYERRVRNLAQGLSNVSLLLEHQNEQTVSDLFEACDCCLLPYRRITGSGVLSTATTLGRGMVASDLPYFRDELAEEPDAAIFFQPGSAPAMRRAVEHFFAEPVGARHAAARRLADRRPWSAVILPVANRLKKLFPDRWPTPADALDTSSQS